MLIGGKAKACEVYPGKFCRIVCEAAKEAQQKQSHLPTRASVEKPHSLLGSLRHLKINQIRNIRDVTRQLNAMNEGPHEKDMYEDYDFVDDISGKQLDHALAKAARQLEI